MLKNIESLRAEMARLRQGGRATITPAPGGESVSVGAGDEIEVVYQGERREIRVVEVRAWGLRVWDIGKQAVRSFRFERIGCEKEPTT